MFYQALLKRERDRKNNKKGFTLIELIIVIAIIGILVAILVPTMSGYMTQAKQATGLANARTAYSGATSAYGFLMTSKKNANDKITVDAITAKMKELLGDDFMKSGTITVTPNGDDTNGVTGIKSVYYESKSDPEVKGTFPQTTTTP